MYTVQHISRQSRDPIMCLQLRKSWSNIWNVWDCLPISDKLIHKNPAILAIFPSLRSRGRMVQFCHQLPLHVCFLGKKTIGAARPSPRPHICPPQALCQDQQERPEDAVGKHLHNHSVYFMYIPLDNCAKGTSMKTTGEKNCCLESEKNYSRNWE